MSSVSEAVPNLEQLKRRCLFTPCVSKQHLHDWIQVYLGFDIPDCIIHPDSNSSPMDSMWEVYSKALKNDDPSFARVLCYAARESFKTLCAAILEVLSIVHLGRSVAHMAAIESQASKAVSYVKDCFSKPYIRDFVVGDNKRRLEFVRYYNPVTGESIPQKEWAALTEPEKARYEVHKNYLAIVICTLQGANSEHVPFFVIDEVDVVDDPRAYKEAQMIPSSMNGLDPITLLTSTRKFSWSIVQKEIDRADKTGLHVRHWNLIDVTQACPKDRHRPDLPRLPIYRSDKLLRAVSEDEFKVLTPEEQEHGQYVRDEGFTGCLQNCSLFAMCQGRLATHQKSKSPMLKKITDVITKFKTVGTDPEMAKAQLLCFKPSTEGLIYPRFNRDTHTLTASQMAEMITGEAHPKNLTKPQLIELMRQHEVKFYSGMDFGYTHNFAVVTAAISGNRCFVFDVIAAPQLELEQKIVACERIKDLQPQIFADPESPGEIKTFRRKGFIMRPWTKYKGSVRDGIQVVRSKLMPAIGDPQLFLLKGDDGCDLLADRVSAYHWLTDAAGNPTDVPSDELDDECDALRYMVMNVFAPKGKVTVAPEEEVKKKAAAALEQYPQDNWMEKWLQENMAGGNAPAPEVTTRGKKGNFHWDI